MFVGSDTARGTFGGTKLHNSRLEQEDSLRRDGFVDGGTLAGVQTTRNIDELTLSSGKSRASTGEPYNIGRYSRLDT